MSEQAPKITREEIEYWRQTARIASPFVSVNPSFLDALCALALQALDMQPRDIKEAPKDGTGVIAYIPSWDVWMTVFNRDGAWFAALRPGGFMEIPRPTMFIPLPEPKP